jgi:molybdenum-dependent DNA-binding transcriptional regulator ModE
MKVVCQNCGNEVKVSGLGRPKLNLDGIKVLATLRACGSVTATAKKYAVSRASIRNAMKGVGLTTKDIIKK